MEWITLTAATVAEAKERLLHKLGVPDAEAEFVVEDEGESKFFGLRKTDARVRARVVPRRTEPRRDRKRGRNDRNDTKKRKSRGGAKDASTSGNGAGGESAAPVASGRARSDRPAKGGTGDRPERSQTPKKPRTTKDRPRVQKVEIPMEQVQENLTTFLNGLVTAFGIEAAVELEVEEENITANIPGQHGVLIGPKARTLDAIQEIAKIASFKGGTSPARVKVDVGDYRKKRAAALAAFASKAAQKAIDDATEVVLDPMSSADRKVVHDALSEIEGIETRSVGTDPRRQVVIAPISD
ncbi:MAG: hypothetical protein HKN03_08570 [Acidimicrobiales bacterium]|nr:hypothetical protein [Acidimicrobiales bacterium]